MDHNKLLEILARPDRPRDFNIVRHLLTRAELASTLGNERIANQRALIRELHERGEDKSDGEILLMTFLRKQILCDNRCFRLRMELLSAMQSEVRSRQGEKNLPQRM